MSVVHFKYCIIAASIIVLCIFYIGAVKLVLTQSPVATALDTGLQTTENRGQLLFTESTSVSPNVVLPASFDSRNEKFDCKTAELMNMTFPMCHYSAATDDTVSGLLLRGIYFEAYEVSRFLRLLGLDRRLQLVDIGANVGLYSLPAARMAPVIAVEPNWRSMSRLAKAVDLGAVSSNITLIQNAVSNVRATFNIGVHLNNQGNAFLINTTKCKATPHNTPCNTLSPTRTILLNDLLPLMRSKAALMKVDVEGHEVNIFTDSTAGHFFKQIDIPLIFMEWQLCKRHPKDIVQRLLNFFYSRNYTVFNMYNSKLKNHYLKWPWNVVFKKVTNIHF